MKILSAQIEGFCSVIGKIKYKWDRPGINLITGKNGHGKTTLINSLAFGLYGQTVKPKSTVLPWPSIINDGYSGLKIRIKLEGEVEIIRCLEYKGKVFGRNGGNRLIIAINGIEDKSLRNKSDQQNRINELVGYSWPLFKSAVLFPQELNSILEEDGPTKKRVFDEAFASAFINEAKKLVEGELEKSNKEYEHKTLLLGSKDQMLETSRALLEQVCEANKEFANRKARQVKGLRTSIRGIQEKKKALNKKYFPDKEKSRLKQLIKSLDDRYSEIASGVDSRVEADEFQLTLDIKRYQEEAEFYSIKMLELKETKTKKCNSCGQNLKGEALAKFRAEIRRKYTECKKNRENLLLKLITVTSRHKFCLKIINDQKDSKKLLVGIEGKIKEAKRELEKLETVIAKIKVYKSQIKGFKKEISRVRKNVQKTDTTKMESDIRNLESEVNQLNQDLKYLKKQLDIQRWLIKDPLSNSGLKAYIFESMLRRVNHFLKYYTKFIGFAVKVGIDLESSNKDFFLSILRNKEEVPFTDLSKGQKQLAKVAVCFALNKTMQLSKPINILLLDELFESLDEENVEIVGNIIMEEAKTRSVHVITHHKGFQPLNCYKTFVTLNDKNQTVIEQKYRDA